MFALRRIAALLWLLLSIGASAQIAATHIYHNHMPNFWPYFDTSTYATLNIGDPIRYSYDGQVIDIKNSPPSNYTFFLPDGSAMPHDDLVAYYTHHAKTGAYLSWPFQTANNNHWNHPLSQTHVTMSASVVNNVNSFMYTNNVPGYNNTGWGTPWRDTNRDLRTTNGDPALDLIHFTGHHSMGPLVGPEYFLKDLIYQNATLAQGYFLGGDFKSSKGFFPTELGFSERLIPELTKLGIEWTVLGNVHYSRTLRDYPYLDDPGVDCLISPPNRADLQNESNTGEWVALNMFNEQQVTHNKFPFASIPHWVRYVDPDTGADHRVAGIPVEQASSWEEGYLGEVKAGVLHNYTDEAAALGRTQYFVIAHDGDNSSGRAGSGETWNNSGAVTYSENGVIGMGVDEYLRAYPIPANDVVHVQDGSWIDTRDSSSDPTWYHWHLPPCIWKGQFADFNTAMGTNYAPKKNFQGIDEGNTVSLEYGYHYLERNFALLQSALNYAKTAEQIWLDAHPNHWQPTSAMDHEITYPGNQLNPWMMSYPVKGDAANDYAGGANPAELAWYFLIASIDSGFGYYDENVDDHVKPTISFNQSLHFSEPYVQANLSQDRTPPSVWWPQRWPYNPGSANNGKAEGWTTHYFDTTFAIYTYADDVSGISDIRLKIRTHRDKVVDAMDNTCRVYDPATLAAQGVPNIDVNKVGAWMDYPMLERDLGGEINGVPWQPSTSQVMGIVPAQKIGNLYYTYIDDFRDQIIDYYIEATDSLGNVSRSPIQQVYVGAGTYRSENGTLIEDVNGSIVGTYPFVTDQSPARSLNLYVAEDGASTVEVAHAVDGTWSAPVVMDPSGIPDYASTLISYRSTDESVNVRYRRDGGAWLPSASGVQLQAGTWHIDAAGTVSSGAPNCPNCSVTIYYDPGFATPYIHHRGEGGTWTVAPGDAMTASTEYPGYFEITIPLGSAPRLEAAFNDGAGSWDSNGGANYLFDIGTWTFATGTITAGPPDVVITNPIDVTVHYQRTDNNYATWGLHLWGTGTPNTPWATPEPFDGNDAWGAIASFQVDEGTTAVNFLVHSGNTKDVDTDRVFDPTTHPEIWLLEGDATIYTSQPGGSTTPIDVIVHYQRTDGNYTPWGLHLWGPGTPNTPWSTPQPFDSSDTWGAIANFQVDEDTAAVNFIVHAGNTKDVDADRVFDPTQHPEIWLKEGDPTIYTSEPGGLPPIDVTIHYYRADASYSNWGLRLWGTGVDEATWADPHIFESTDTYGALTQFQVDGGTTAVNFQVISGNLNDGDERSFDPTQHPEIWLIEGDAMVYLQEPDTSGGGDILVKIHYQRNDGNYTPWGLHLWGEGVPGTTWEEPRAFESSDSFGALTSFEVADTVTRINFIIHAGNTKDVDADRFFDPTTTPEIWLLEGDATIYTSQPGSNVATVTVHYQRADGNYTPWGLHLWGNGMAASETATVVNGSPSTEWNNPKPFSSTDTFGAIAEIQVVDTNQLINFIIHSGDTKDVNSDRSFLPANHNEIWLLEGDATIYTTQPTAKY